MNISMNSPLKIINRIIHLSNSKYLQNFCFVGNEYLQKTNITNLIQIN